MRRLALLALAAACAHPAPPKVAPKVAAKVAPVPAPAPAPTPAADTSQPPSLPTSRPLVLDDVDPSLLGDAGDTTTIAPILDKGQDALAGKQWDRAIAQARAALAIDADQPRALALLARAFIGKEQWDSAHAALLQAVTVTGSQAAQSAELWRILGRASYHLGNSANALVELGQAVKLKKDDAAAWNLLGVVHLERGEPNDAVQALENAHAHADTVAILTNLGSAYRRAAAAATTESEADGFLEKAEQAYTSAREAGMGAGHGDAPAALGLALLYLDAPRFPKLDDVARLERAVKILDDLRNDEKSGLDKAAVERDFADATRDLETARHLADTKR